jgi:hypothetical protein
MAASLVGLVLLLGGGRAWAQQLPPNVPPAPPPTFAQDANSSRSSNNEPESPSLILKFTKDPRNDAPAPSAPVPPRPDAPRLTYSKDSGASPATAAPAAPRLLFAKDGTPLPQKPAERNSGDARPDAPASLRMTFTKDAFAQDAAPPPHPVTPAANWAPTPANPSSFAGGATMSSGSIPQAAPSYTTGEMILSPAAVMPATVVATVPAPVTPPGAPAPVKTKPVVQRVPAPKEKEASSRLPTEPTDEYNIQLEPPGPQRLFKLESEAAFFERMRQEARQRPTPERIEFPAEPVVSTQQVFAGRYFPPMTETVEPAYVCYGRLFFEVKNLERYGWDLGPLSPALELAMFTFDTATLPYHLFTDPCRKCECNAGYCLPGDPVPFMLYPPGLSVTGLLAESAVVVAIPFLLP